MKNLIITLVLLGGLFTPEMSEAQRRHSELKLRMFDNSYFTVIFDRQIYDNPTNLFRLSNVTPGTHRIIIKQRFGGRYGALRTIFNGHIDIPGNSMVNARINKFNRLVIRSVVPIRNHSYSNHYSGRYYKKPMLDMHRLRHSIQQAGFESDKRIIAQQAISEHRVKAHQVYKILLMFSFESTKLKVAKFAYRHCIDKRNYYIVNDAFAFRSSIRSLNDYIAGFRSDRYDHGYRGEYYHDESYYTY
jgi:hypothetical protein